MRGIFSTAWAEATPGAQSVTLDTSHRGHARRASAEFAALREALSSDVPRQSINHPEESDIHR
jgi:hypothetical protein